MKKIDIHLHLTYEQLPKMNGMFVSSAENMLAHLDQLGIQRGVLMATAEFPAPQMLFGHNQEAKLIAEAFPDRYSWMCSLGEQDPETLLQRMASYKEQGAIAVGEIVTHKAFDDPFVHALFAAAEQLNMPVLFHMSPQLGMGYGLVDEPGLPLLEQALQRYPNLIFIGHSQPFWHEISADASKDAESRNAWGQGPVVPGGRVVELFETYPNLYGDLSANSGGCAMMREPAFGLAFLERFHDRLLFGTDMINIEMSFPLGGWLDEQYELGKLSQKAYQAVCAGSAQKLFSIT